MNKVLVVVDMQNDFIDGSLGTKEACAIVDNVVNKITQFDGDIIATFDTHQANYLETSEGKNLPVEHCIEDTDGWKLNDKIQTALDEKSSTNEVTYIKKPTFGSIELGNLLVSKKPSEIELVGLCTDICVVSNALIIKANLPETPISVDASCCAGVTVEKHNAAIETMSSCQIKINNV
ncbi:cysteine hydrolase family protein [Lachnobacterium bovis]|uniref:cysteine hydrolase family protein n=1 Tax=Lachnobacterium bovis TaxID=140626 RepID=UPI00047FA17A|nr:isochorismatase family cysteine hydrolase [Lachnobacterium bovis]